MYRVEVEENRATGKRRYRVINNSMPFETEPWASPFRFRWSAGRCVRIANKRIEWMADSE